MLWLELPLMKVSSLLIGGRYNSLVIGCWLLVVGYWLLVVGCWLFCCEIKYQYKKTKKKYCCLFFFNDFLFHYQTT